MVHNFNCRATASRAVGRWTGVALLIALCAVSARANIVDMWGSAEPQLANPTPYSASTPFYTHKQTSEASNCATGLHGHANCPLSTSLQAFNEQQQVTLFNPISTSNPGFQQAPLLPGYGWQKPGLTIPAGQVVNSHYIWLNAPPGFLSHDIATFKFDGPILGIVGKPEDLIATNGLLGFDVVTAPSGYNMVSYTPTSTGFVNEDYPNNPADPAHGVPISGDIVIRNAPAVLTMDFTSFSGDYIRVVTAANVPLHAGDFNHDYAVDYDDYTLWRATFGSMSDLRADGDGSGIIDGADYVAWRSNMGYSFSFPPPSGAGAAVLSRGTDTPEASSLALLTGGIVLRGILPRTRRRFELPILHPRFTQAE